MPAPTPRHMAHRRYRAASAFTLIELAVTMTVIGVVLGIGVFGWMGWNRASEHESAAQSVESTLRQVQQQAVTEGSSMCVEFDTAADTWTIWRGTCTSATRTRIADVDDLSSEVHLDAAEFSYPDHPRPGVTFTPRGTASPGKVTLGRDGTDHTRTVTVEGLTGRVTTH